METTSTRPGPVTQSASRFRRVLLLAIALGLAGAGWWSWEHRDWFQPMAVVPAPPTEPMLRVATDAPEAVDLDPELIRRMHVEWTAVQPTETTSPLLLTGQLMLDPSRLVHVQTRFTGEVIAVGQFADPVSNPVTAATPDADQAPPVLREIQVGDRVARGQLLAVIWSREVGEKKSDLVDALSNLWLHEAILKKLKSVGEGTVAQRAIEEMQRQLESDLIAVSRMRRTLRSWHINEYELDEIEHEAIRIHQQAQARPSITGATDDPANLMRDQRWAEIDIHAPRDGIILEKNFTVGDIVDPALDLYKLADLKRLDVLANVYEDDLPRLLALAPDQRQWRVEFPNQPHCPQCSGRIETIGHVIDPSQHTTILRGWVDNPEATGDCRRGRDDPDADPVERDPGAVQLLRQTPAESCRG